MSDLVEFVLELATSWRFYLGLALVIVPAFLIYTVVSTTDVGAARLAAAVYMVAPAVVVERRWKLLRPSDDSRMPMADLLKLVLGILMAYLAIAPARLLAVDSTCFGSVSKGRPGVD